VSLAESVADRENLTTIEAVTDQINAQVADIISWVKTCKSIEFLKFEKQLLVKVYDLARLFISLFLWVYPNLSNALVSKMTTFINKVLVSHGGRKGDKNRQNTFLKIVANGTA
jgi:hypothetical protein